MSWFDAIQNYFPYFFYVFIRTGVFVWLIPPFGTDLFPAQLRMAVAFVLTFVLCQIEGWKTLSIGWLPLFALSLREAMVGGALALLVLMIFAALHLAADLINQQAGLEFTGSDEDSEEEQEEPIVSSFVYLFGITIFLLINGHHTMILLLKQSLGLLPVGEMSFNTQAFQEVIFLFKSVFVLGFQMAIPALFVFFMTSLIVMSATRGSREIGTYVMSLPVRVVMGWVAILLTLPVVVMVFQSQISKGFVF
jgi:flagellar biosynthetic protein FliR